MPESHPLSDLIGHKVEISLSCGCTRVLIVKPGFAVARLGPGATLADIEAKSCRTCKQNFRPRLALEWAVSGGRDRRPDPPPLPEWATTLLE